MATLLQVTNKVLKRLREDTVTDLTSDYANLVASMVADISQEVNDATVWTALDHEVDVTCVNGTQSYDCTATTNKSQLLFQPDGDPQCWMFESSSGVAGQPMTYLDPSSFYAIYQANRSLTAAMPTHFTIEADTTNDILKIRFWPTPSSAAYCRVRFNTPETELDPDTDASTELKMNDRLLRLGALMLSLNERGEEMGEPGNVSEKRYYDALAAAVEDEIRARERTGYYDWHRN